MRRPLSFSPDTTPDAARVYYETLKRLGPTRRMEMGAELSNAMRARLEAGVRMRHPDYDDEQVRLAVARLLLGEKLFREVFPGCDVRP